jgi:hypothetical protein
MSTDFRYYGAFLIGLCEGFVGMQGRPDTVTSWTTNSRHVLRDSARDISTFDLWYISEQANRKRVNTAKLASKI